MEKWMNRAFLALLLAVLLAVPAGTALWSHRETTAYYENRTLAELPDLSWESLRTWRAGTPTTLPAAPLFWSWTPPCS